ncbi:zinc finger CCCH domain-containing protein 3 isoform X2 [Athalia rosae]|uniref:zinc finger CCCH domain-containing protein 3 isoform X2 n=1 Tax=Athalia rosae TaxID=37344 RepID=UPI002033946C|nr:zinc finger CCCH domain-containing protein 3 isoform X2 [Athalia rosae]
MENDLLRSYGTRLMEHRQRYDLKNSLDVFISLDIHERQENLSLHNTAHHSVMCNSYPSGYIMPRQSSTIPCYTGPSLPQGRVHVNPNFKPRVPGIHINPRIATKSEGKIHVNPKMMSNFTTQNLGMSSTNISTVKSNPPQGLVKTKIEPSVHVNPILMKKLSLAREKMKDINRLMQKTTTELKGLKPDNCSIIQSKTKLVKNNTSVSPGVKRLSNSNLVSLSRRKLVRIRKPNKTGSVISPASLGKVRRLSNSNMKKAKVATKYKLVMVPANVPGSAKKNSRSIRNQQACMNKYKIDRTHIEKVKKRFSIGKDSYPSSSKRTTNTINNKATGSTTGLVRIGGILYKSSRNQLIRSSNDPQPSKKKRCIINVKGDRFVMASNGKKLRRLNTFTDRQPGKMRSPNFVSRVDIGGMTFVEKTPNILVRAHTKHNISNKAKQRSIQILRNKMRKNNQPCLIFQKFGYCAGQGKGTCPKLHDKKQVALCRNFLQGKCLLDDCPMSHAVCPEKMPTCKYFLEGCCIRDNCPYLHVKVSSNTPVCTQFLQGYCPEANKCKQRHVYLCPEFERSASCAKGKYCPYPHKKNNVTANKKSNKIAPRKVAVKNKIKKIKSVRLEPPINPEDRKRYYDEAGSSKESLEKMRQKLLNSLEIMKRIKTAETSEDDKESLKTHENNEVSLNDTSDNSDTSDQEHTCPKRTPLGPLPAYIPFD